MSKQEKKNLTGVEKEVYRAFLEEKVLKYLMAVKVAPLCVSMKENEGIFSFISDRELSTTGGKLNFNCDKIARRVSKQLQSFDKVAEELAEFQDYPVSEEGQQQIRVMISSLKSYAIKYGYCKQACDLLRLSANPNLVGTDFAGCNAKEDIVKVLGAYGRRSILEGKPHEIKDDVNQLIADVVCGYYGSVAREGLSQKDMDEAYNKSTVVRGDMVFKMDGTHERKTSKDKV